MPKKILVIDDDISLLKSLKDILSLNKYFVTTISNPTKVEELLQTQRFNCILLDIKMPEMSGEDLQKVIVRKHPDIPVVMISAESTIETAVNCIKNGAYDFIEKPIDPEKLFVVIKNAIYQQHLQEENRTFLKELENKYTMVGKSKKMQALYSSINEVAGTSAKVLIFGETGTGKELVARAIHHNSTRRGKPFICVNCAAIPSELLESELFGHKKGAFTGAFSDKKGKFFEADGGTLFLDEIGDLNIQLQAKLLRVLQEEEVEAIGENIPRKIDVRIIAATNKDLIKLVKDGNFRQDLFYRLKVVEIFIPPLRDRTEDIPDLIHFFLKKFNNKYNKQVLSVESRALALLVNYKWPGNIRELENLVENLVIFTHNKTIKVEEIQKNLTIDNLSTNSIVESLNNNIIPLKDASREFEKNYILRVMNYYSWKKTIAANALGIDRSNLFKKMRDLGISNKN